MKVAVPLRGGIIVAIRRVTDKRVVYLFSSHASGDHSSGGWHFREDNPVYITPRDQVRAYFMTELKEFEERKAEGRLRALQSGKGNICCMATHARGAVSEMVLGSVARHIVQEYPGPVVLVGPRHVKKWAGPVKTVHVCVDGSPLSEQALAPAVQCARLLDATLQLIQVLDPETTKLAEGGDSGEWVYLRRLYDQLRKDKGIVAEWEVLHGRDAADAITSFVDDQPGSLIVMCSHGRSGLNRLVMGSVAQSVLRGSRSPVWIIRPRKD